MEKEWPGREAAAKKDAERLWEYIREDRGKLGRFSEDSMGRKRAEEVFMQTPSGWIKEQIEHVWRAIAGGEIPKAGDGEVRIRHAGEDTFYNFIYKGRACAEARSYYNRAEKRWMFELTQVAREYYPKVREYFTKKGFC